MNIFLGLMIPFIGTAAGAACVFFIRNKLNTLVQKALLGFASGVMVAASVWSLLIPAMDMSESMGKFAFVPAAAGFALGILFLLFMDKMIPHLHMDADAPEGPRANLKKTTMLVLAVTLHNIPEGMAVGVVFAGLGIGRQYYYCRRIYAFNRHCHSKFSGGCDNFAAALLGVRYWQKQGFPLRGAVGGCRTCGRICNNTFSRISDAGAALSFSVCGRSNDLCCCGGAYTGGFAGQPFKCCNDRICCWIFTDDDIGVALG